MPTLTAYQQTQSYRNQIAALENKIQLIKDQAEYERALAALKMLAKKGVAMSVTTIEPSAIVGSLWDKQDTLNNSDKKLREDLESRLRKLLKWEDSYHTGSYFNLPEGAGYLSLRTDDGHLTFQFTLTPQETNKKKVTLPEPSDPHHALKYFKAFTAKYRIATNYAKFEHDIRYKEKRLSEMKAQLAEIQSAKL